MKQTIEINDYYEYEIDIHLEKTPGQIIQNIAVIEVRLYEKGQGAERTGGGTTTRSLINTYKEEVKRPNMVQFLLGLSWQDRIESVRDYLKNKAIFKAAELWKTDILPKEIQDLIDRI